MSQQCHELENIKYKSMLMKGMNHTFNVYTKETSDKDIEYFLQNDMNNQKKECWNKLDKTTKLKKLYEFIDEEVENKIYQLNEGKLLKSYVKSCLDKKKLGQNKDIEYNIETSKITKIPNLHYNKSSKTFTLKKLTKENQNSTKKVKKTASPKEEKSLQLVKGETNSKKKSSKTKDGTRKNKKITSESS